VGERVVAPTQAPPQLALPAPVLANPPPPGFTDLATIEGLWIEVRYATPDNFMSAPLTGYGVAGAWLRDEAAEALAEVVADLRSEGLGLRVYDAYRPTRASAAMVAWASRTRQLHLLHDGYIGARSLHSAGVALDVTLVELPDGTPMGMGSAWDTFTEASHYKNAEWPASFNRELLRSHMRAHGFRGYSKEWWHFTFPAELPEYLDVPYACFEPAAGDWVPPRGWQRPGWRAPPHDGEPSACLPPAPDADQTK
jgi:D-alanyl-D-alanine dipeptidase